MHVSSSSLLKVPTMIKMRLQCVFIYFVPGGLPIMANTERLRLKGVPLLGIRYMKGRDLLVGVYERMGRSVISVCKT